MTEQILRCRRPIRILAAALALAMTLAMTLVCVPRAQAYMWPAGDQNLNIKCYTLSTGNTAVYSTKDCAVKCGTVFGSDLIFGEELGAHAYAEDAGLDPRGEVLLSGFYTAGYHQFRPRHRSHQTLHQLRAQHIAGEYLAEVATHFLGSTYLADATATRCIGHQTTIADL